MAGDAQMSQTQVAALGEQHLPGTGGGPGSAGMSPWGALGGVAVTAASLYHCGGWNPENALTASDYW